MNLKLNKMMIFSQTPISLFLPKLRKLKLCISRKFPQEQISSKFQISVKFRDFTQLLLSKVVLHLKLENRLVDKNKLL